MKKGGDIKNDAKGECKVEKEEHDDNKIHKLR